LGKVHPTKRLEITAVDPLAEAYDAILSKHGVMPLVRTQHAVAERLVEYFSPGSFDLVTARNCLDHASDPLEAIRQILLTTRKGGVAVLEHVENEGEKEGYKGMHAWNFFVENNRLLVRGRGERVDISETLSRLGDFHAMSDGGWVNAWIRRT
jgi:SAM-dependent methyltransferase